MTVCRELSEDKETKQRSDTGEKTVAGGALFRPYGSASVETGSEPADDGRNFLVSTESGPVVAE